MHAVSRPPATVGPDPRTPPASHAPSSRLACPTTPCTPKVHGPSCPRSQQQHTHTNTNQRARTASTPNRRAHDPARRSPRRACPPEPQSLRPSKSLGFSGSGFSLVGRTKENGGVLIRGGECLKNLGTQPFCVFCVGFRDPRFGVPKKTGATRSGRGSL